MKILFDAVADSILDVKQDKRTEVFNWGIDNAHPSLVEGLISNSVTAKTACDKVAKAIYGKSFGVNGMILVNSKGQTLNQVLRLASKQFAKFNNVFLQVAYDANLDIKSLVLIPTKHVRLGKADDKGYSGKFVVYDNWDKVKSRRIEPSKFSVVNRFNPNKRVIQAQIEDAGSIGKYKGQIIHIQKDSTEIYSESDLLPVLDEALLEANSQKFRSRGSSKGFLNIKIMAVKPFATEEERNQFKRTLTEAQGAENAGKVVLLESSSITGDLKEDYSLEDLSSAYNDELFKYSDEQAKKNIALAFSIPRALLDLSDNTLFGDSAAMIGSMKQILWESRAEDREMFEDAFNLIGQYWAGNNYPERLEILNNNPTPIAATPEETENIKEDESNK